jgi:hypothetical protein
MKEKQGSGPSETEEAGRERQRDGISKRNPINGSERAAVGTIDVGD